MRKQADDPRFEQLFREQYAPLVRALAVAAGSVDAAHDAVQDAFVQAHRHWDRIVEYQDPVVWLRRVAVNRISNQRRAARRQRRVADRIGPPGSSEFNGIDRVAVSRGLADLSEQQRLFVALYYLADLSLAEVADACDSTVSSVRTALFRVRGELSKSIGDQQ